MTIHNHTLLRVTKAAPGCLREHPKQEGHALLAGILLTGRQDLVAQL